MIAAVSDIQNCGYYTDFIIKPRKLKKIKILGFYQLLEQVASSIKLFKKYDKNKFTISELFFMGYISI